MPTFKKSPCIDCLVHIRCKNRFISRLNGIRFYENKLTTSEGYVARAAHETVLRDCTDFCLFVAGLTSHDTYIDKTIEEAINQSFKGLGKK